MRVIIYTGKGGVGKTSLAAATALGAAAHGHRTLVLSTDSAHSLGDSLGTPLGPDPRTVAPNVDALEIDVLTELERSWKAVHEYLLRLLASQGVEEITAQEVVILPGMELIAALLRLDGIEQEHRYDTAVLDTAPTAETLRLLSFPDAIEWYFDRVLRMQRRVTRVVRSTVGRAMKTPLPSEGFFDTLEELHERFRRVRALLTDPGRSTVRLVVNPERMVIAETQRAYTYLCLFGLTVELLVVNRIMPKEATSGYFAPTRSEQDRNLGSLEELFGALPQLPVPRYPREVIGRESLDQLGKDVFGENDPARIWPSSPPIRFRMREGAPSIELTLPLVDPSAVQLSQRGDTLYLTVGAYRRSIALPVAYTRSQVERAYFDKGTFVIRFRGGDAAKH
ncbi:MAG: ArsA family ATPase [Thermoplasmata archaeon]|nr:ArsA family ATPase [Thermoplasmata archaeon]MCI4338346.1 ArsA family ATPase [Thermoplasmata archaeon]MCI4341590.1 ArsA family ATPase [Thermoplasmata archaeon]